MVFRNTIQGMGYSASALAASVMEIIGRSGAGILAVYFNSFFIICISSPAAWILAMIMCMILRSSYMKVKNFFDYRKIYFSAGGITVIFSAYNRRKDLTLLRAITIITGWVQTGRRAEFSQ